MTFKRVTVKKNERGLLLRNGDFDRVLSPGTHWLVAGFDALKVETCALEQPAFNHPLADYLMAAEPAIAALAGFLLLSEQPTLRALLALFLVSAATIGVARSGTNRSE